MKHLGELNSLYDWVSAISDPRSQSYSLTLFSLAWGLQPKLIYEIGVSRAGESTVAFLVALRQGGGHLVSCDIVDYSCAITNPDLLSRWAFKHTDSFDFIASLSEQAQLIYIDGAHDLDRVLAETERMWPLLAAGGLMVLHDTQSVPEGPGQVLQRVRMRGVEVLELPYAHGLGLIRKRLGDPIMLDLPQG